MEFQIFFQKINVFNITLDKPKDDADRVPIELTVKSKDPIVGFVLEEMKYQRTIFPIHILDRASAIEIEYLLTVLKEKAIISDFKMTDPPPTAKSYDHLMRPKEGVY